jgi:ketosteroid isomerase-like protein
MRAERALHSVVNIFHSAVLAGGVKRTLRRQQKGEVVEMTTQEVVEMAAQDDVDEFIQQLTLALGELMKGNPEPVKKCYSQGQDVTLGDPFGPFVRGWEQVAAVIDHAASQFRNGEMVDTETVKSYVTPEFACLVTVERAKAKVGGEDAVTPINVRATTLMAPEDGEWKIVHRHVDAITTARPAESVIQQ